MGEIALIELDRQRTAVNDWVPEFELLEVTPQLSHCHLNNRRTSVDLRAKVL